MKKIKEKFSYIFLVVVFALGALCPFSAYADDEDVASVSEEDVAVSSLDTGDDSGTGNVTSIYWYVYDSMTSTDYGSRYRSYTFFSSYYDYSYDSDSYRTISFDLTPSSFSLLDYDYDGDSDSTVRVAATYTWTTYLVVDFSGYSSSDYLADGYIRLVFPDYTYLNPSYCDYVYQAAGDGYMIVQPQYLSSLSAPYCIYVRFVDYPVSSSSRITIPITFTWTQISWFSSVYGLYLSPSVTLAYDIGTLSISLVDDDDSSSSVVSDDVLSAIDALTEQVELQTYSSVYYLSAINSTLSEVSSTTSAISEALASSSSSNVVSALETQTSDITSSLESQTSDITSSIETSVSDATTTITSGYSSEEGEEASESLSSSLTSLTESEESLFGEMSSAYTDSGFSFNSISTYTSVAESLSLVSTVMVAIYSALGGSDGIGIVLSVAFTLTVAGLLLGLFSYVKVRSSDSDDKVSGKGSRYKGSSKKGNSKTKRK